MQKTYFVLSVLVLAVSCSACSKTVNQPADTGTISNLKLVWSEEFNYTGPPDPSKWGYEKGFVRNKEPQYYTAQRLENCRVENGMLVLEARKEKYKTSNTVSDYTSASIITLGKQTWQYGRIEVRAKVPAGAGSWAGSLDESMLPMKFYVDYVRVYQ